MTTAPVGFRSLRRRIVSAWSRYWFEPAPLLDLGIARVVLCALALWSFSPDRHRLLPLAPAILWEPIPLLAVLGVGPPDPGGVHAMVVGLRVSLWLGLLGILARPALLSASVLLLFLEGMRNSFGKVGHGSIPILWALLFFALSPCDRAFSLRRVWERVRGREPPPARSSEAGWPLDLVFVELATFYLAAGLSKLRDGGLAWADGETLSMLLVRDRGSLAAWVATSPWLCSMLATLTLVFELGAIAGVVRRLRPWVLAAGVAFHVGSGVLLGIWFSSFLGLYLLFVPWTRWIGAIVRRSGSAGGAGVERSASPRQP